MSKLVCSAFRKSKAYYSLFSNKVSTTMVLFLYFLYMLYNNNFLCQFKWNPDFFITFDIRSWDLRSDMIIWHMTDSSLNLWSKVVWKFDGLLKTFKKNSWIPAWQWHLLGALQCQKMHMYGLKTIMSHSKTIQKCFYAEVMLRIFNCVYLQIHGFL